MRTIYFKDLGSIEYGAAWQLQEDLMKEALEIKAASYQSSYYKQQSGNLTTQQPDNFQQLPTTSNHLLFCTHPHVYTLGKSGHMENLLVDEQGMQEINATFYKTNRGGDITYHGPGQIVGYPVLDLEHFFTDLGRYMRSLEEVIILTLKQYGIEGDRLPGATGVWLEPRTPHARKICAMGVKCSRWVTIHGFALNVNTDLGYFNHIVPCGIDDKAVTSMQQELGHNVDEEEVKALLKKAFGTVFEATIAESSTTANTVA